MLQARVSKRKEHRAATLTGLNWKTIFLLECQKKPKINNYYIINGYMMGTKGLARKETAKKSYL